MPKGDGTLEMVLESLKILIEEKTEWVSNDIFKEKMKNYLFLSGRKDENSEVNGPYLIKKSEIARYFNFIEYNFEKKQKKITQIGKEFYNAKTIEERIEILFKCLSDYDVTFGRKNNAVQNSESDLEVPILILKLLLALEKISKEEIAIAIYLIHNKNYTFLEVINKILNLNKNNEISNYIDILVKENLKNKYYDLKVLVFYKELGLVVEDKEHKYFFNSGYLKEDYKLLINNFYEIKNRNYKDRRVYYKKEIKKIDFQKIVYGAPGTGKSYSLNQEAKETFKREILLEKFSDEISTKKYWIVTCGENNWAFEEFKRQGIYSIGWEAIKNISKLTYAQLEKEVVEKYNNKFGATQLNNIAHEMKVGDILLVRKGVKNKEIVGYGVISQEHYEKEVKDNTGKKVSDFYHNIGVDWKEFSPTKLEEYPKYFQRITTYKANPELIKEFEKIYPQETPSKFDTKEVSTIERVTFYDGYTYGQFVGMYKPITLDNGDISYEYVPGPFMKQLVLAYKNSKDKFCLLIEEINRAKADKVFGNIFQLLDRNSQGESEYPISLSKEQYKYLKENLEEEEDILERIESEGLYLPNNLYIWATMNSADDGVQPLDTAFKRRWKFNYISLNANKRNFGNGETFIIGQYKDKDILWNEFRTALNDTLKVNITEDRLIAPFFISPNDFEEIDTSIKKIDKNILSEKVLMYIFDDLLRHYPKLRKEIFHNDVKTFSDIHEKVTKNENFLELIFNEGFLSQILGSDGIDGKD